MHFCFNSINNNILAYYQPTELRGAGHRRQESRRRRRLGGGEWGGGEGVSPLPSRLGGLGSVVSSLSGLRGGAPAENDF